MTNYQKPFSLAIITPFYNEESATIEQYFHTMIPILASLTHEWRIICINDGSTNETQQILMNYAHNETRISVINFSRNFGKEAAITAGLKYAINHDAVIPLDADLQDPPSVINTMIERWQQGYDVVLAKRNKRQDAWCKRWCASVYYWLLNKLTNGHIPPHVGDFRLLDKKVVQVLNQLPEKSRYMKGIFSWVGFKTTTICYRRPERECGIAKQSFAKLWKLALDGIFAFSTLPLKVWTYIGLAISSIALLYALWIIINVLFYGSNLPGYSSIMVAILFMGGINLFSLGIMGEYIARIYKEVKNRPLYVIDTMANIKPLEK